jgi:hypothetical protein
MCTEQCVRAVADHAKLGNEPKWLTIGRSDAGRALFPRAGGFSNAKRMSFALGVLEPREANCGTNPTCIDLAM